MNKRYCYYFRAAASDVFVPLADARGSDNQADVLPGDIGYRGGVAIYSVLSDQSRARQQAVFLTGAQHCVSLATFF